MKNLIKTASLLVFTAFFACSNNTTSPASSSPSATDNSTTLQGLAFNGNSDSGKVEIFLANNYLEKVVNGNPYSVTPGVFSLASLTIKTEVKLTGFYYMGQSVDITCDKDDPANKLYLALTGSNEIGQDIQFMFNPNDGLFYTFQLPSFALIGAQNSQDEISDIASHITPSTDMPQTFFCRGSDNNDYNVTFHSDFDDANMKIMSIFDIKDKIFTGAIEVVKDNSNDAPVQLYFDK
jgi:hypothetical protein